MIKLVVLKTNSIENALLFLLVKRGSHADVPDYFSVYDYDLEEGFVKFTLLDRKPAPRFKVGVAGNLIVVSEKDVDEVKSWLKEWNIKLGKRIVFKAETPVEAQKYLQDLRKKMIPEAERKIMLAELTERIKVQRKKEDDDLISYLKR